MDCKNEGPSGLIAIMEERGSYEYMQPGDSKAELALSRRLGKSPFQTELFSLSVIL